MSTGTSIRVADGAARLGAGWSILSGSDSVGAVSGHVVPIETGFSPFGGGPTLAIVGPGGEIAIVASNLESTGAETSAAERVHKYVGFSADRPESYLSHYLAAVADALDASGVEGRVAVEPSTLPWLVADLLRERGSDLIDASREFAFALMVKTEAQLERLRHSAKLAALAQRTAIGAAEVGISELELFAAVRGAVEEAAGQRVAFAGDVLTGVERTSGVAGWPSARRITLGDMVLVDLAPRVDGYWSDSCNTFVVGRATGEFARMHELASSALRAGIDVARPGVPVNEIDHAVRSVVAAAGFHYPHHTGHGIGTSVHEFPRIIPGETTPLEAGMVILLEPGVYQPGIGGVRLEWMFEVTEGGLVRLTDFEHDLTSTAR
ncbi:MAG: Xaa-Pro peptidase family protein [Salinibacterium sp.]|nr:Xaa-Pro peptidase family protein [Salinibacterium sp.]